MYIYIYTYVNMYILWDTGACWCMRTHTSQVCMGERACVCVCMCIHVHTHAYTSRCVCFVCAALGKSVQICVCMSICVFCGDIGLFGLLWRRMATCLCIGQLHTKLRCKWWRRCWRPTRLGPAGQLRYEEGKLGAASCVVPACVCGR